MLCTVVTHVCCCVSHTCFSWMGSTDGRLQTVQLAPVHCSVSPRGLVGEVGGLLE